MKRKTCDDFINEIALKIEDAIENYEVDDFGIYKMANGWYEVNFHIREQHKIDSNTSASFCRTGHIKPMRQK